MFTNVTSHETSQVIGQSFCQDWDQSASRSIYISISCDRWPFEPPSSWCIKIENPSDRLIRRPIIDQLPPSGFSVGPTPLQRCWRTYVKSCWSNVLPTYALQCCANAIIMWLAHGWPLVVNRWWLERHLSVNCWDESWFYDKCVLGVFRQILYCQSLLLCW